QPRGVPLARRDFAADRVQRSIERGRGAPFIRPQIRVARGKSKTVLFPHDRTYHNLRIHIEIPNHLPDDPGLLRILAAEEGKTWLHNFKQLQHHGRHTTKMPGSRASFETLT